MRGKERQIKEKMEITRITPAYAGKSGKIHRYLIGYRDHPRVCGEKDWFPKFTNAYEGSPPRMRGKERVSELGACRSGITPAYAGKRSINSFSCWGVKDHPRVCGEKFSVIPCIVLQLGSPPRMRGKGFCCRRMGTVLRITPAYAGKRDQKYRDTDRS